MDDKKVEQIIVEVLQNCANSEADNYRKEMLAFDLSGSQRIEVPVDMLRAIRREARYRTDVITGFLEHLIGTFRASGLDPLVDSIQVVKKYMESETIMDVFLRGLK